jgi:ornithine cyclodeaminase
MAVFIKAQELEGLISIAEAVDAVEKGFASQEDHPLFSLPRQRMLANDRRITVHSGGCVPLSVAGTFVHYERHNFTGQDQSYGVVGTRVYVGYDSETGALLTVIAGCPSFYRHQLGEGEFATETAITSAVGTRHMARVDAHVLGLYGTGRQARYHVEAMCAIRSITEVKVYSRNADNRRAFCSAMQPYVDAELKPVERPEEVARNVDIIVCATNSNVPVVFGRWLEEGVHVTSIVGSNKELISEGLVSRPRRELDDEVLARADVIIATLVQQGIQDQQGDLLEPVQNGVITWGDVKNLSALLTGDTCGRWSDQDVTLFKQNSDQGVGYMALARLVHDKARAAGIGMEF